MRTITAMLLVLFSAGTAQAQVLAAPPSQPTITPAEAQARYEHERKSPGLALTLEAVSPIAGMGTYYTGTETDKATFLAITTTIAAAAGVGGVFWLIHLDREHPSGGERALVDFEQATAISLLVTSGLVYLLSRASGLSLASQATDSYNEELQRRLSPR